MDINGRSYMLITSRSLRANQCPKYMFHAFHQAETASKTANKIISITLAV